MHELDADQHFVFKKGVNQSKQRLITYGDLKGTTSKTGWENSHEKQMFVFARNASSIISGNIMFTKHNMTFFKNVLHILKCIPTLLTFCITTKGLADGYINSVH